jgi:CRISPR-associated protein Csb2
MVVGSVFSPALVVFRLQRIEGPTEALDWLAGPLVLRRWREALLSCSNDLSPFVRALVSGHEVDGRSSESPHVAYCPVAASEGRLAAVAVALPCAIEPWAGDSILELLRRVEELRLGRLGVWGLQYLPPKLAPVVLARLSSYTANPGGARCWASLTPVSFDRHPKVRAGYSATSGLLDMVRQSCKAVGLPEPSRTRLSGPSFHRGFPAAGAFPLLVRKDGTPRQQAHVWLEFAEPILGPVLLGAGRYRGYGVCAVAEEVVGR